MGDRQSGLQRIARVVLVTARTGEAQREIEALARAAAQAGLLVVTSDSETDVIERAAAVLVRGGWGTLTLAGSLERVRSRFPAAVTIAVATPEAPLEKLLRAGFDDAIKWPDGALELAERLRGRVPELSSSPDVRLDAPHLSLLLGDVTVRLTKSEFRILQTLFKNAERWVSSEELRLSSAGATRVTVHVRSIRRKLGAEAWRLRARYAQGYSFDTSQRGSRPGFFKQGL